MLDTQPTTRTVTERNSPPSSGESTRVSAEREPAPEPSTLHPTPTTFRDQLSGWLARSRDYWVPPSVLADPPASYTELVRYARDAGWTAKTEGPVRRLGAVWLYTVTLPTAAACRYVEWITQRPGRAIPTYIVWKLFVSTGPGPWMVEHLFRPILAVAAWVLL